MTTIEIKSTGSLMNGKLVENTESKLSPEAESFMRLTSNLKKMYAQWLTDYSDRQSDNNVKRGIAGQVEFF